MKCCPVGDCGRKFENDETMLEHVRRRHPAHYDSIRSSLTKSVIEAEHAQQQELNKLPKLQKIMSREKKNLQIARRSSSKNKKQPNLSAIIQDSRHVLSTSSISARRPSLKTKFSDKDSRVGDKDSKVGEKDSKVGDKDSKVGDKESRVEKLPSLRTSSKKKSAVQLFTQSHSNRSPQESLKTEESAHKQQNFYTTAPHFNPKPLIRLKSKQKKLKPEEGKKLSESMVDRTNEKNLISLSKGFEISKGEDSERDIKKNLSHHRPAKRIAQRRPLSKDTKREPVNYDEYDFQERVVVIKKWPSTWFDCPKTARVQSLFLNSCGLTRVTLNDLGSLIELSLTHNNLADTDFLRYARNTNIRSLHLDYNQIKDLYAPPKLKVLTASFNKLGADSLETLCESLSEAPDLQSLDLSFNEVRKASNYKLRILSGNSKLKSIDGLKVTRIDIEMMQELNRIEAQERGLIPLSYAKDRPTTAATALSHTEEVETSKTVDELEIECARFQKKIKKTKEQLSIIEQENNIIGSELEILNKEVQELKSRGSSQALFNKLQKEVECLELLNFLAFADEEQLLAMVSKKKLQMSGGVR